MLLQNFKFCNNISTGRSDRTWTCGPLTPSQVRYQTSPHPDKINWQCTICQWLRNFEYTTLLSILIAHFLQLWYYDERECCRNSKAISPRRIAPPEIFKENFYTPHCNGHCLNFSNSMRKIFDFAVEMLAFLLAMDIIPLSNKDVNNKIEELLTWRL